MLLSQLNSISLEKRNGIKKCAQHGEVLGAFSLNKPKIKTSMKKFTNNSIILTGIKKCGKNREESIFKMKTFMKKSAKNSIILKL